VADIAGAAPGEVAALTARRIAALRASDEGQEGMAAFLEKRPPRWLT
jgi:methylglutaconyl-CoA hydratase